MKLMMLVHTFAELAACETYSLLFKGSNAVHRYEAADRIFAEFGRLRQIVELLNEGNEICTGKGEGRTGGGKHIYVKLERRVFSTITRLLDEDIDGMSGIKCKFLHHLMAGVEYLELSEAGMSAVYQGLAKKSLSSVHYEGILNASMDKCMGPALRPASYLSLLRGYAAMCGVYVGVEDETATICSEGEHGCGDLGAVRPVSGVRITPSGLSLLLYGPESGPDSISTDTERCKGTSTAGLLQDVSTCMFCNSSKRIMEHRGPKSVKRLEVIVWILQRMAISKLDLGECGLVDKHIVPLSKLTG